MKKVLIGTLAFAAVLGIPALTHAALYQYVNTSGSIETVNADTAADALTIPTDRDPHSGVALVTTAPVTTTTTVSGPAGTYLDQTSSADTAGETLALVLEPDGSAALATNYENGATPTVETGTWIMSGTNQITLTLPNSTVAGSPTETIIFSENGSVLTATQYDNSLYGSNGLTFIMQS